MGGSKAIIRLKTFRQNIGIRLFPITISELNTVHISLESRGNEIVAPFDDARERCLLFREINNEHKPP